MKSKIENISMLLSAFGFIACLFWCLILLHSCTVSFQNIATKGTASDLVDENQTASPTVETQVNVPSGV